MKRLSRPQEREKLEHVEAIRAKEQALEQAVADYNAKMEEAKGPVERALEELNAAIEAADAWRGEVAAAQEDFYADRSERWQEGEAGAEYDSWKSDWATELEQAEIEFPEGIDAPSTDAADNLENLPDAPG